MSQRVKHKWRPPLWFVLAGPLAAVFVLPLLGVGYFRLAGGVLGWREASFMIGVMALLTALILAYLLWRLVLLPVRSLTDHARAVAKGQGADPLEHFGTPEFSDLGQSVLDMGRVLQGREMVVRSYGDHVTHELKSPLSAIGGAAELLDGDLPSQDRAKLLGNIRAAVARMDDLLEGQRAFARASDPLEPGEAVLSAVVKSSPDVDMLRDGTVPLHPRVLDIVLENLIGNARAVGATRITLSVDEGRLIVSDTGPGVSEGNRDRIFDPFFTTRREAGGTGMGLAIVRRMLEAQGAEITLESGLPTRFVIGF